MDTLQGGHRRHHDAARAVLRTTSRPRRGTSHQAVQVQMPPPGDDSVTLTEWMRTMRRAGAVERQLGHANEEGKGHAGRVTVSERGAECVECGRRAVRQALEQYVQYVSTYSMYSRVCLPLTVRLRRCMLQSRIHTEIRLWRMPGKTLLDTVPLRAGVCVLRL